MHTILVIGGLYSIAFGVFHLLFWRLFNWRSELPKLNRINRAVMPILNLCLTFVFLIFAYVSIVHADELITTPLGNSLLALMAVFWLARAIEQIIYFGLSSRVSVVFFIFFTLGFVIYATPFTINLHSTI